MQKQNNMSSIKQFLLLSSLLAAVFNGHTASAATQKQAVNTSKAAAKPVEKQKASFYELSFENQTGGPTFRNPDGKAGPQTKILFANYLRNDFRVQGNWQVRLAPGFTINTAEKKTSKENHMELLDPYLGFLNQSLFATADESFNLAVEFRNYFPISQYNKNQWGDVEDNGNGRTRLRFMMDYKIPGTSLLISTDHNWYHYRAKRPVADGTQDLLELSNAIQWEAGDTVLPYVAYNNYWTYQQNGIWQPWAKNHMIETGTDLVLSKRVLINPFFETPMKSLKDTTINLIAKIDLYK